MELFDIMLSITAGLCFILLCASWLAVIVTFLVAFSFDKFWKAALTLVGLAYVVGFLIWLSPIVHDWQVSTMENIL